MAAKRPAGKATTAKEKAARVKEREKAAKAKEKQKATRAEEREKAAKAKEKQKAATAKEREKAAKVKEREKAAKVKEREKAARVKEREKAAKVKEKQKATRAKEREKAAKAKAKAKEKQKAAKAKERNQAEAGAGAGAGAKAERQRVAEREGVVVGSPAATGAGRTGSTAQVEDLEPPVGQDTSDDLADEPSEADPAAGTDGDEAGPAARLDPLPEQDTTVRQKGYLAEALGKEDLVGRSTQRATVAASYTTRDHDLIRAWAESRGGRPADVNGTGRQGRHRAGVLRVEFLDGPGDHGALEAVDWPSFFATFDDSDVDFLYQERVRTGEISRFHKFVRADA